MIIEIRGTGCINKGAHMMLLTVLEQLSNVGATFTVQPTKRSCEYPFYSKLGLHPKLAFKHFGIQFERLGWVFPKKLRKLFGLISDSEVDIILDASGFRYSSQWRESPTRRLAASSERWKKAGKKLILLPQAFGPFKTKTIRNAMACVIRNAELVYARDDFSRANLLELTNQPDKIKLCPDFTVLFEGVVPEYYSPNNHQICIVPNARMLDKRSDSKDYERFIVRVVSKLQARDLAPYFLSFGGNEDVEIAERLNEQIDNKIPIIKEDDPYFAKGMIQASMALIGSRFHSLASALYSAIPTFGTGWSHKYEALFKDFGFKEGLLELTLSDTQIDGIIDYVVAPKKSDQLKRQLEAKVTQQKQTVEAMFSEVKDTLRKMNDGC